MVQSASFMHAHSRTYTHMHAHTHTHTQVVSPTLRRWFGLQPGEDLWFRAQVSRVQDPVNGQPLYVVSQVGHFWVMQSGVFYLVGGAILVCE